MVESKRVPVRLRPPPTLKFSEGGKMERLTKVDDQGRLLAYSTSDTGLPAIIMKGNPYRELIEIESL